LGTSNAVGRRARAATASSGQEDFKLSQINSQALERRVIDFSGHS
jgi:hypothetical protein